MRYIKIAILLVIALVLVTVLFANHQVVSLTLLPEGLETFIGLNAIVGPIAMPLYAVALGGVVVGLVIGFFWEWVREYKHRREASRALADKATLESQVKKMKARENAGKDPILVMVEETA